jgi:hypothetical protein
MSVDLRFNKRLVVGAHYGWRDFLVQRITVAR